MQGILRALERCDGYSIYNLGNSDPVKLGDLIAAIEAALGKRARINRLPLQPGDVDRTYADLTRSRAELGFSPETDLTTGLANFVAWLRSESTVQD